MVAVVAVAAVAPLVRDQADRSSLRRLQALWVQRGATHNALFGAVASLDHAAGPQDTLIVGGAVAALQREDVARLRSLGGQAAATSAYGAARRLRADIGAALAAEEHALLSAAAAGRRVDAVRLEVSDRTRRVDTDLLGLRRRLQVSAPAVPAVRLHAGDPVRRRLSRLLDASLGVRLLVNGPGGASVLDFVTNRVVPRPDVLNVVDGVVVGGYLVSAAVPQALVVRLGGGPPATIAVPATAVGSGPGGKQVWLGDAGTAVLAEVTGRVLRRVAAPGDVRGAVPAGLVVFNETCVMRSTLARDCGGQLSVWDPTRRRTVSRLGGCSQLLGSNGNLVVAQFCPGDSGPVRLVHVIDVGTGPDRAIRLPAGEYRVGSATLAPDGQHLALVAVPENGDGRLLIADLLAGTVTTVPVPSVAQGQQVWTADSQRLFFTAGSSSTQWSVSLWTYAPGDRGATAIRIRPGPVTALAVLPQG